MPEIRNKGPYEEYLGDGLYADFDGFQIWLSANDRVRGYPTDKVAIDISVLENFERYIKELKRKLSEVNNASNR